MPSEIHFQTASLYLILIRQESFNLIGSDGPRLFTTTLKQIRNTPDKTICRLSELNI